MTSQIGIQILMKYDNAIILILFTSIVNTDRNSLNLGYITFDLDTIHLSCAIKFNNI